MPRWPKPLCVSMALISLVLLSTCVRLQPPREAIFDDAIFNQVKLCDTPVAKIPSLIMYPAKGEPVVVMLSAHNIQWDSGGSMEHTICVPAEDAERARQLIFDQFPDVHVVWLPSRVCPSQEQ